MHPDFDQLRHALEADYLRALAEDLNASQASTGLECSLLRIVRSYRDDLELAASLGQRIASLESHLSRIERRADQKRHLVAKTMEKADIATMIDSEFTVLRSRRAGALVVSQEGLIPERFWKAQRELDRDALLAALRMGKAVLGASLGASEATISVRSR